MEKVTIILNRRQNKHCSGCTTMQLLQQVTIKKKNQKQNKTKKKHVAVHVMIGFGCNSFTLKISIVIENFESKSWKRVCFCTG